MRPVQCLYEFDPEKNILFSEEQAGSGIIETTHTPDPDTIAYFGDSVLFVKLDECTSCTACLSPPLPVLSSHGRVRGHSVPIGPLSISQERFQAAPRPPGRRRCDMHAQPRIDRGPYLGRLRWIAATTHRGSCRGTTSPARCARPELSRAQPESKSSVASAPVGNFVRSCASALRRHRRPNRQPAAQALGCAR